MAPVACARQACSTCGQFASVGAASHVASSCGQPFHLTRYSVPAERASERSQSHTGVARVALAWCGAHHLRGLAARK